MAETADREAPAIPDNRVKIRVPDFPASHHHPGRNTSYRIQDGDEGFIRVHPWDVAYFLRRRDEGYDLYDEPEESAQPASEEAEASAEAAAEEQPASAAEAGAEAPARRKR